MILAPRFSVFLWGLAGGFTIAVVFYVVQVLGMQDLRAPIGFMADRWYFVAPLLVGFGTQVGLFRAMHLHRQHGGGVVVVSSGGMSGTTMFVCCLHNLIPLFPVLGVSGLAAFFSAYQSYVFLFSIVVTTLGVWYMAKKYRSLKRACATHYSLSPSL